MATKAVESSSNKIILRGFKGMYLPFKNS